MRLLKLISIPLLAVLFLQLAGCSTTVTRVEPDEKIDLSGAWNDTDSRLVAEEMISDMLNRSWLPDFVNQHQTRPTVIVGTIRNLSHEHINVQTFIHDIEREVINSNRVTFVASSGQRGEIRAERKDQDLHAREDTRKAMGQELGADFMLTGTINTIIDMENKTQLRYYQIDLNLISLRDNRIVWIGSKKIKKLVENSKLRP